MIYILRNNKQYGPYDECTLLSYVNNGQILLCDKTKDVTTLKIGTVRTTLKKAGLKVKIAHKGNLASQLLNLGSELIVPKASFFNKEWLSDKRLLMLAFVGLFPSILMIWTIRGFLLFYIIAFYFSVVWGIFFFYFFKTSQVSIKTTIFVFFVTQILVFVLWDILGLVSFNPFYNLVNVGFPINIFGYVFGVGLSEEFVKLLPLIFIYRLAKEPLVPQTMVFYGLMSGIAFGVFEGVQYQMTLNSQLDYSISFFMNIARLTILPFLHAIWCGIAGYFIAFAHIYPKYRISLYFLALAIPIILHGLYDSLCSFYLKMPIMIVSVILLMTYLKQGINYQSKLRN